MRKFKSGNKPVVYGALTITAYWLPQETIAQAFEAGAREWIGSVKAARAERRKQSDKCKADAARINATRHFKIQDPRQDRLWGEQ